MALCLALAPAALSADGSAAEDAETLYHFGLFQGKGAGPDGAPDFALNEGATRAEAAVMLTRLMGKEAEAQARFLDGSTVSVRCSYRVRRERPCEVRYAGVLSDGS